MSSINNQTQDLFALDTVQDLDDEAAAAVHGGAKIILYTGKNFTGAAFTFAGKAGGQFQIKDLPRYFRGRISSARVVSGRWVLEAFSLPNKSLELPRGGFGSFPVPFNNRITKLVCKSG